MASEEVGSSSISWVLLVSIVSLMIIILVTIILFYQYFSFKDTVNANLDSVVSQVNDINHLNFNINAIQDDNIKSLDNNLNILYQNQKQQHI